MDQTAEISQPESRVKKQLINAKVNFIFFVLTLIITFFSRRIFLDTLGASFVGLTGSLNNLLGFLNLAELGISTAIGVSLYKPLFDRDHAKIGEIISVMGYLYRWIGIVILIAGVILSLFLPVLFPSNETGFSLPLVYFAYYSFLASSLIGYFINYRQILLGADQRNYVVAAYFQTANIIKTLIQLTLAYYTGNYFLWVCIEFIFGIIYAIILNVRINQTYPWLKTNLSDGKRLVKKYPEIAKQVKQLFVHKLSSFVQFETMPMLIYTFVNLSIVAFYQNYMLVLDKVTALFGVFLNGTGAGVGNLIAEGNREKIIKIYWELFTLQILMASVLCFMVMLLINPFISLWLGAEYILSKAVLGLIIIRCFIGQTRNTTDMFLAGYGLFSDMWAPVAETFIYLITSVVGGFIWGLEGVLLGGVISYIVIVWGWKPIFLFTKGLKLPLREYWKALFGYYVIILLSALFAWVGVRMCNFINPYESIIDWITYAMFSGILFLIPLLGMLYLFKPSMKMLVERIELRFK